MKMSDEGKKDPGGTQGTQWRPHDSVDPGYM